MHRRIEDRHNGDNNGDQASSEDEINHTGRPHPRRRNQVIRRNNTTFIGTNVRAPFLGLSRYDKDRGGNTRRGNAEILAPEQNQQDDPIIVNEETTPKEIM